MSPPTQGPLRPSAESACRPNGPLAFYCSAEAKHRLTQAGTCQCQWSLWVAISPPNVFITRDIYGPR